MSSIVEKIKKVLLGIMILATTGLLVNSCVDPMYDMSEGISTEIQIGGDSLALPIGTTDTMRLGDFLSPDDLEFLRTMEDGGYGISISDSMTLDDLLRDVDVSKLKFDDKTFSQVTQIDFGDIDISDFTIPNFSKTQEANMNMPSIEVGNIVPTIVLNTDFSIGFSDYALSGPELEFDIPPFLTELKDTSNFEIFDDGIPDEINDILSLHFVKTPGATYDGNLIIKITTDPNDWPPLTNSNYQIVYLDITFPDNFTFDENPNLSGNVYSVQNIPFDIEEGYLIELNLKEIDFEDTPINDHHALDWSGSVSYAGQISVSGRANSKDISSSKQDDPVVNLKFETAMQLDYATVVTNPIKKDVEDTPVELEFEIDITENARRLGRVNVEPGCKLRIDITQPNSPLPLEGDEILLQFSDLYIFYPDANLDANNQYHIKGEIPDYIELELEAFLINRNLDKGYLLLKDTFHITGSTLFKQGTVNSAAISSLEDDMLTFRANISNINIVGTSIEMNTLLAQNVDSTLMEMEIEDMPSQITALDSILFKDGGKMELEMTFNNLPHMGDSLLQAEMILKFPDILIFEPGMVNDKNELIIDESFDRNNRLSKTLGVRGFKFDASELSGKLTVNDKIRFETDIFVVDPTVNTDDLQGENITANVSVELKGLNFRSVYGKVDINLGDQMEIPNVPLDKFPEFMRNKDAVIDVLNPILALKTESNLGIPIDTKLSLTKFVDGKELTDEKIFLNFSLPKVNSPDEIIETGYWYAPRQSGMPNGYTFAETHLQNLFKPVPDSVQVEFVPTINPGVQHMIDLVADYKLKVKYDIILPLSFGKDLNIVLRDTIENVNLEFGDLDLKTGALEILAKITNSIPLDLEMELIMMDADHNILSTSPAQTILAGASDGSGVDSNIRIKLADNLENLKDLNKVVLVFKATSNETVAGTPIKPTNFIKANLRARVLGGLNVTLKTNNY